MRSGRMLSSSGGGTQRRSARPPPVAVGGSGGAVSPRSAEELPLPTSPHFPAAVALQERKQQAQDQQELQRGRRSPKRTSMAAAGKSRSSEEFEALEQVIHNCDFSVVLSFSNPRC